MVKKVYTNGTLSYTTTSWSDSYETKVIVGGATENTAYYFVNSELLAKKNPDGSKYYIHNDHLGSASVITNSSGALVESTTYDPWGEIKTGGTKSKFLYTGQENDPETNLDYYNARYYDPHIRRFTQPDDFVQNIYDPQQLNLYSYAKNNPLRYIDPTGHVVTCSASGCYSSNTVLNPVQVKVKPTVPTSIASSLNTLSAVLGSSTSPQNKTNVGNNNTRTVDVLPSTSTGSVKDTIINYLPQRGYWNMGISASIKGYINVGLGVQMNRSGYAYYASSGFTTKGRGGQATGSFNNISANTTSINFQGGYFIGGSLGSDKKGPVPFSDAGSEYGFVTPGSSFTLQQTFNYHSWDDETPYSFIQKLPDN